jgi:RNA polymerase sigma-70 factor (ECF subfamily)
MTDASLAARAQAGEEQAFTEIVLAHERELGLFLYRRVHDPHVVQDLLQETFLAAWKAIRRTRHDLMVRAWLYKIALNAARQWERRQRVTQLVPFLPHTAHSVDEYHEQDEVQRILGRMKREDAELLLLKTTAGFNYAEIGALLSMRPDAVRQRLHRARERFRALYEREREDKG